MSLSDLLQLCLNFTDSLILELLDLFEGTTNHAESLRVDSRRCQNLVSLSVFSLQAFLDCFKLLLEDQVAQTSLAVDIIDDCVELFKELLLLLLDVLVLLEAHFVLPLQVLILFLGLHDFALLLCQQLSNLIVLDLPLLKASYVLANILERLHYHVVVSMLDILFTISRVFTNLLVFEVSTKRCDHVHIQTRDVIIVIVDVLVLLVVLSFKLLNTPVLLSLYLCNLCFALSFHVFAQARHLGLILLLDFVGNSLILLTLCSRHSVEVLIQSVRILCLAHLLLFLLHFEGTQVLLKLTFIDSVLVLSILELNLSLFLDHCLFVEILEEQMFESLPPDLDRDVILFAQVLMLSVFVTKLGLFVFFFFLSDQPEVVDS